MRSISFLATTVFVLAALMAPNPVTAQKSTTRGFTIGAHLQGASLTVEDDDESSGGGGFGVRAGYGFNRRLTGYLEVDGIQFDVEHPELQGDWMMGHVDLGVRFNFANSLNRWVPFLEGALGARFVGIQDARSSGENVGEVQFNGGAASIGGGVSFFTSENFALETLVKFSAGTFEEIDIGDVSIQNLDIEASSFRFKLGVSWWP